MRTLGAILAGGEARRFGSDKAHALFEGKRLIDRVTDSLSAQADSLIVCGRDEPGFMCIVDQPKAGLGPLGGLNAALIQAQRHGFDRVLSAPCDVPDLPDNLGGILAKSSRSGRPAFIEHLPLIGLWPTSLQPQLARYIQTSNRSMKGFVRAIGAVAVELDRPITNINRPADLT